MHLAHASWCHRHYVFPQNVSIVMWWQIRSINLALLEAFKGITVRRIDQMVIVVAKGKWAGEVQDRVAISVLKVNTFRCFTIYEALQLQK